jgi:hypothetical protein
MKFDYDTAFVFAPGASLRQYEDEIWKLKGKGLVIGTNSCIHWMLEHGLEPDFVVAVDRQEEIVEDMKVWGGPVVCPTNVHPGLSRQNDCYYFNVYIADWNKLGMMPHPIDVFYHVTYPGLWGVISVGHVTGLVLPILEQMNRLESTKINRVVLIGADYSYWKGMGRVPRRPGEGYPSAPDEEGRILWKGHMTNYKMLLYKARLFSYWQDDCPFSLYSMSKGIMPEIPGVTFDDLLAGKYPLPLTKKQITEICDQFLGIEMQKDFVEMIDAGQ